MAENDNKIIRQEILAISSLTKAVELELQSKKKEEADKYFKKGKEELQQAFKNISDASQLPKHQAVLQEFLDGPDIPKEFLQAEQDASRKVERIEIEEDSTGHSYESLFGNYLNKHVTDVEVLDSYIREDNQIQNFVRLCELIVRKKIPVKTITLTTKKATGNVKKKDLNSREQQDEKLQSLGRSLAQRNIQLQIKYSDALHDREIRLSTGWVINIGRGLDYFKNEEGFKLGLFDLDLRPCRKTTVHIFHKDSVKSLLKPANINSLLSADICETFTK